MSAEYTDQLFGGILEGAKTDAAAIIDRAENEAKTIQSSYGKKIIVAVEQEKQNLEKQLDQIRRKEESSIRNLKRRYLVSRSERLRTMVLDIIATKMASLVDNDSYRDILVGWIAEATIGLDRSQAQVLCSFKEKVDDEMLREAEALVKKYSGRDVTLKFGGAKLTGQGVEVSSMDGKVAYNNQVATRLVCHERDLKELMEGKSCLKE